MKYGIKSYFTENLSYTSWCENQEERDELFKIIYKEGFQMTGIGNNGALPLLINYRMVCLVEKVEK